MGSSAQADLLSQLLKFASHMGHTRAIALVALVLAALVFAILFRAEKKIPAGFAAFSILVIGVTPFVASAYVHSQAIYHVQLIVIRPDQSLADIALVKSSNPGILKMVPGGWQLDIPAQLKPADGNVNFSATVKDEFLYGSSTLVLGQDYYPTSIIQLVADTSATLRGVVVDENMAAVAGARVSIEGRSESVMTDHKGNFVLAAHAGKGQMVEVNAQKGSLSVHQSAPAGKTVELILAEQ